MVSAAHSLPCRRLDARGACLLARAPHPPRPGTPRRHADGGGGSEAEGEEGPQPGEEEEEDKEDEQVFSPERGNVAFGSAYDGWAFRIDQFAEMYAGG